MGGTPATYANLQAALGTNGANIPDYLRKGGMSVKFVQGSAQSSDNKYIQARLMADEFTTDVTKWQGVDEEPTAGSANLIKSGSLVLQHFEFNGATTKVYLQSNGFYSRTAANYSLILPVKGSDSIYIKGGTGGSSIGYLRSYNDQQVSADFCECVTSTTVISAATEYNFTTPSDCKYIIILVDYSGSNRMPQLMSVNGFNIIPNIGKTYKDLFLNSVRYTEQSKTDEEKSIARTNIGAISNDNIKALDINVLHKDFVGYITANGGFVHDSTGSYSIIPISGNDTIYIKANDTIISAYAFLKSYKDDMIGAADFCTGCSLSNVGIGQETTLTAPADAKYLYIRNKGNDINIYEPESLTINGYDYYPLLRSYVKKLNSLVNNADNILQGIQVTELPFVNEKCINTSLEEGTVNGYHYAKVACLEGDVFTVNATTNVASVRCYMFIDASNNIIYMASSGVQSVDFLKLVAPENAAFIIINDNSGRKSYKGEVLKSIIEGINADIDHVSDAAIGIGKKSAGGTALLLEKQIEENWPYYLDVPALPVSFDDGNYLEQRIQSVPEGKHSLFITDSHFANNKNSGHGINIADYVKKRIGASVVSFGGDCVNYVLSHPVSYSKYGGAARLTEYASKFFAAFGKDGIWIQGNHDCNAAAVSLLSAPYNDAIIPDTEAYKRTVRNIEDVVVFDDDGIANVRSAYNSMPTPTGWPSELNVMDEFVAWMKMHYYYDDDVNKVRYIVLETNDGGYTLYYTINSDYSKFWMTFQIDFVAKALLSVPDGYDVIIHGHMIGALGDNNGDAATVQSAAQKQFMIMLNCYRRRASKTLQASHFGADDNNYPYIKAYWDIIGERHSYNFINHKGSGRVIVVCGHYHMDLVIAAQNGSFTEINPATIDETTFSDDVVFLVWRNRDCFTSPGLTERTLYGVAPVMTEGTVSENSFDIMTIDNNYFYFTRFGANGSQGDLRLPY